MAYVLSDFEIVETLAKGSFGKVCRAKRKKDDFALKITANGAKEVEKLLTRTKFPFIVDHFAIFEEASRAYTLVAFAAKGDLFASLPLSLPLALFYAAQTTLALEFLESLAIVYRSLKPEHALLDSERNLQLCDFGLAKIVDDKTFTLCGTPDDVAPEVLAATGYAHSVDWWALGVFVYEILEGQPPFAHQKTPVAIYEAILAFDSKTLPKKWTKEARSFMVQALNSDRSKRLGCRNAVRAHPWFRHVDWDALFHKQCPAPSSPKNNAS